MIKRVIDLTICSAALIILSPLLIIFCIAVFLEDGKQPIFIQQRYGKNLRIFNIFKIRTMRLPPPDEKRKIEDLQRDNRITKVGRFLRSAHFDELLQLINIIKGDMSIVGPRPIPCIMKVDGIENWKARNVVLPGLTGMAQLYCTKYTDLRKKIKFDILYIRKQSLWLDIKLIAATAWSIKTPLAFMLWTGVILAATLMPISEETIPSLGVIGQLDKVAHFSLFAIMTYFAFYFGNSFLLDIWRSTWFATIWGMLLSIGTEFAQSFLPLRNMSVGDFRANLAGIAFMLLILFFIHRQRNVQRKTIKTGET